MRKPETTAAGLLKPVLDLVNDKTSIYSPAANVARWESNGRHALEAFLRGFDGSAGAGHAEVLQPSIERITPDELQGLGVELNLLLECGFGMPEMTPTLSMPTLRLGARNTLRPEIKRSRATRREQRTHDGPGAFVLQVAGSQRDMVLFLTLHLLSAAAMAGALRRCQAPVPGNRSERCNNWFVRERKRGQPRLHCSDNCRVRFHEANSPLMKRTPRSRGEDRGKSERSVESV